MQCQDIQDQGCFQKSSSCWLQVSFFCETIQKSCQLYTFQFSFSGSHENYMYYTQKTFRLKICLGFQLQILIIPGFPGGTMLKNPPLSAREVRDTLIPGSSGRSPGREHSNPLQYSCLENLMDRGVWPALVHNVTESWT